MPAPESVRNQDGGSMGPLDQLSLNNREKLREAIDTLTTTFLKVVVTGEDAEWSVGGTMKKGSQRADIRGRVAFVVLPPPTCN